jgi:hypothetical protein
MSAQRFSAVTTTQSSLVEERNNSRSPLSFNCGIISSGRTLRRYWV